MDGGKEWYIDIACRFGCLLDFIDVERYFSFCRYFESNPISRKRSSYIGPRIVCRRKLMMEPSRRCNYNGSLSNGGSL